MATSSRRNVGRSDSSWHRGDRTADQSASALHPRWEGTGACTFPRTGYAGPMDVWQLGFLWVG